MNFLVSFHIVLSCSFVVLLAYVLSRLFTHLAHSVIHGSHKAPTRHEASRRQRRSESTQREIGMEYATVRMAQLEEEEEEEDENEEDDVDTYQDADLRTPLPHEHALKFEMASSIFDDGFYQECNVQREDEIDQVEDDGKQASCDNDEGMKEEGFYVEHDGGAATNPEYEDDDEDGGSRTKGGDTGMIGGLLSSTVKLEEEVEESTKSMLIGDMQAAISQPQQRLPPTWSDLERIVNLSSKKHSPPSSVIPPLPE